MIRCSKGTMERVAWSDALDHVAHRFQHIIARDGPARSRSISPASC
jgi:assimilatory nitrate reductase catalytic subunit